MQFFRNREIHNHELLAASRFLTDEKSDFRLLLMLHFAWKFLFLTNKFEIEIGENRNFNSHNHTLKIIFFIAYFKRFCYSYSRATIISKWWLTTIILMYCIRVPSTWNLGFGLWNFWPKNEERLSSTMLTDFKPIFNWFWVH